MDGVKPSSDPNDWQAEPVDGPFATAGWHERLAALYAYWRRIRPAPDLLPGRQHFDPIDVPKALASIWLLDVQREPLQFRYRLIGTNVVRMIGGDFTGQWFDEARPAIGKVMPRMVRYRLMVETGRATWRKGTPLLAPDPYWKSTENVLMPLADDGRNVDMLLCASVYYNHDGTLVL